MDKIVGPGNAFVAEAKRQLFGVVDIDQVAGPSEILIVADENRPIQALVAADLLSQAEHDADAHGVLVTTSLELAHAVQREVVVAAGESAATADRRAVDLRHGQRWCERNWNDAVGFAEEPTRRSTWS